MRPTASHAAFLVSLLRPDNLTVDPFKRGSEGKGLSVVQEGVVSDGGDDVYPLARIGGSSEVKTPWQSKGNGAVKSIDVVRGVDDVHYLATRRNNQTVKTRMYRVIKAHTNWVRAVVVDPSNSMFYTGGVDQKIIIFDLANGSRKLTLTGHTNGITSLAISSQSPYLYSAGDDRQVFCWDLTTNSRIRSYNGHLSGVLSVASHSTIDMIATGSRDSSARIWDVRTQQETSRITDFKGPVQSVVFDEPNGFLIASSADSTIHVYDLRAGKTISVLTHHSKAVRAVSCYPNINAFCSVGSDGVRSWKLPECNLMREALFSSENVVHGMSVSCDGLIALAGNDGTLDILEGTRLSRVGSVCVNEGDRHISGMGKGLLCCTFDHTGTRVIAGCQDSTVRMFKVEE